LSRSSEKAARFTSLFPFVLAQSVKPNRNNGVVFIA